MTRTGHDAYAEAFIYNDFELIAVVALMKVT